jgi:hypothetical protein
MSPCTDALSSTNGRNGIKVNGIRGRESFCFFFICLEDQKESFCLLSHNTFTRWQRTSDPSKKKKRTSDENRHASNTWQKCRTSVSVHPRRNLPRTEKKKRSGSTGYQARERRTISDVQAGSQVHNMSNPQKTAK